MKYFNNPISETTKPDPFILEVNGFYYCYSTHVDGVKVSVSKNLINFEDKGFAYACEKEKVYWAPSVVYINGIYYLYYSSVSNEDSNTLDETLKVGISNSPLGPFEYKKQFFDYFSIDSHPYFYKGELYMFYSTNIMGCDNDMPGTSILLDKMKNPLEFAGNPTVVVAPSLDDEIYENDRFNDTRAWYTIEGAAIMERNDKLYILYSANSYLRENYFINYSVGDLKDDLRDIIFEKYPNDFEYHALMKKNSEVGGTGHNSVCKGPDLIEDFIVYHGRNNDIPLNIDIEQRTMRLDRLNFDGDRLLCDGPLLNNIKVPESPKILLSDVTLNNEKRIIKIEGNYIFELWLRGTSAHSGIRYGFNVGKSLEFELLQGKNVIQVFKVNGSIKIKIKEIELNEKYDHTVSQFFKIIKIFDSASLLLEDGRVFKFDLPLFDNIEIISHFSSVKIEHFALNTYDQLEGENLIYLSNFLEFDRELIVINKKVDIKSETLITLLKYGKNLITIEPLSNLATVKVNGEIRKVNSKEDLVLDYKNGLDLDLVVNQIRIAKYKYTKNCNE